MDAPPADTQTPGAPSPHALVSGPCPGMPATAEALAAVRQLLPQYGAQLGADAGHSPKVAPISTIMTRQVVALPAAMTLEEATKLLLNKKISGAPVTDESQKPVGIVSKTDLLEAWHEHERFVRQEVHEGRPRPDNSGVLMGDIMVPYLLAAPHSCSIALAAALMAFEGVHRLLVLDDSSQMVGIVSSLDVLRWLAQFSGFDIPSAQPRIA